MRNIAQQTCKMHKEWLHSLHSFFEMPTANLYTDLSLLLVRANVRKHTKADNVKNPPHIKQKVYMI